jgi:hypothetical protein
MDGGAIELEPASGCLRVVLSGRLRREAEVAALVEAVERARVEGRCTEALVDARGQLGESSAPACEAVWRWLASEGAGFDSVALVLATELAATRADMTAVARGAPVRAFCTVQGALVWLRRRKRSSSTARLRARRETVPAKKLGPRCGRARGEATASPGFRSPAPPADGPGAPSRGGREE